MGIMVFGIGSLLALPLTITVLYFALAAASAMYTSGVWREGKERD